MKVTKKFKFEMAHRLQHHEGLCFNIHGHSYVVDVTIEKEEVNTEGPETGMVMDFGNVKEIGNNLFDQLDHAFMVNTDDKAVAGFFRKQEFKTYEVNFEPTAENMAKYIYNQLKPAFRDVGINIYNVRVWETSTAYADYNPIK